MILNLEPNYPRMINILDGINFTFYPTGIRFWGRHNERSKWEFFHKIEKNQLKISEYSSGWLERTGFVFHSGEVSYWEHKDPSAHVIIYQVAEPEAWLTVQNLLKTKNPQTVSNAEEIADYVAFYLAGKTGNNPFEPVEYY